MESLTTSNKTDDCQLNDDFIYPILPREFVRLIIGLTLVGIYTRLLYVLLTRKHLFSSAFYTFVILNGFASLICYVSYFNIQKLPIILYLFGDATMFEKHIWLLSLNSFFASVSRIITFMCIFCMSLNRCSLIMNLPNANYYWERYSKKLCIFFCILPMIQYANTLFSKRKMTLVCYVGAPFLNRYTAHVDYFFNIPYLLQARQWSLFMLDAIILPISLIANIQSIRSLRSKRNEGAEVQKTVDKHSRSLLNICILEFAIHLVDIFFDIVNYVHLYYFRDNYYMNILPIFSTSILEITNLSSCLVLIICSPTIRKEVFTVKSSKVSSVIVF